MVGTGRPHLLPTTHGQLRVRSLAHGASSELLQVLGGVRTRGCDHQHGHRGARFLHARTRASQAGCTPQRQEPPRTDET
jgi:hypothetical protein